MLEEIQILFPEACQDIYRTLLDLLPLDQNHPDEKISYFPNAVDMLPIIGITCPAGQPDFAAQFVLGSEETITVRIENTTAETRAHTGEYMPIPMDVVSQRLQSAGIGIVNLDHAGFNLPWFGHEPHPRILQLREQLAPYCLYHLFPSGEPWDFILPAEKAEILGVNRIDYSRYRQPKFELVSFNKCSRPLIQFDIGLNGAYETLRGLFPEALDEPQLGKVWIYIANDSGVDICLVAGRFSEMDWSDYFRDCRL